MIEMTPLQYARKIGITKQAIFKRLKKGGIALLPGVVEIKTFPKQTILVVDGEPAKKNSKKVA